MPQGPIWTIEIGTLDVVGGPFCAMAVDVKSRLLISSRIFVDPAEIVAMLDEALTFRTPRRNSYRSRLQVFFGGGQGMGQEPRRHCRVDVASSREFDREG